MAGLVAQSLNGVEEKVNRPTWQPAEGPLFVVGMWRSGTSLLYALLNQHSQIALMYEEDLTHLRSLFWLPRDTPQWLARWDFWNEALTRHKVDTSEIPSGISDLRTAARAVYLQFAKQKNGATVWGCKSPTYHDEIIRLSQAFPNARFVIIWRDLRSICRSIIEAAPGNLFFSRRGFVLRAVMGYHAMKVQCDALLKRGGQVHQIHYEDLVRDPGATMQEICKFLEIPFNPRMSRLEGADRTAIEEGPHHSLVKSEEIVASRNSPQGLPPAVKSKVERYIHMWRKQYSGAWPLYPEKLDESSEPSLWERLRDRIAYKALSFWHHMAPVVFSFIPLVVWEKYRKFNYARRYARSLRKADPNAGFGNNGFEGRRKP
ncbi:MAG: sulfotransferase [Terriglobales bacterium]